MLLGTLSNKYKDIPHFLNFLVLTNLLRLILSVLGDWREIFIFGAADAGAIQSGHRGPMTRFVRASTQEREPHW